MDKVFYPFQHEGILVQEVISSIWNLSIPAGAWISTVSPTTLPRIPLPIGEVTEIFPTLRSASFSLTIW